MGFASFAVALMGLAFAPAASAQKGVVGVGADPYTGVASADGASRYVTVTSGDTTVVERIDAGSGRIEKLHVLNGGATIPAVAYDGTPGGLSFDGKTLVLPEPAWRFPQRDSRLNVLDAESLRPAPPVKLDGTWTYDAISPSGRWLYLIEYTSPRNLTEYAVRAYDLRRDRLVAEPVIDPDEPGEEMYGTPVTRATSVGGRWEYTLYESAERGHPPFIHALDTERRTAVCVDLDALTGFAQLSRLDLQLNPDGSSLSIVDRGEPALTVNLETFAVAEPSAPATSPDQEAGDDGGISPLLVVVASALLAGGSGLLMRRRRNAPGRAPAL